MTTSDPCKHFRIHDPEFARDPYPTYARLREECPVIHSDEYFEEHGRGGFWLLTRYDDVAAALRDWKTYSSAMPGVEAIPAIIPRDEPLLPIEMDPPHHTDYRALISPVFRRRRVEELHGRLTEIASELLSDLVTRPEHDVVADFAQPFSLNTLAAFMNLPREDTPQWRRWVDGMLGSFADPASARVQAEQFGAYIDGLVRVRMEAPQEDFVSMLLEAEVQGKRLTPEEIRAFVLLTLIAGHDTTSSAMSITLEHLSRHPALLARLRAEPALIPTAVEEFLRYSAPIQTFGRNATRDVQLHGEEIGAGDVVALSFGSANRDPSVFDRPDEVVVDRSPNRHLTFGTGPHLCVGAHVARLELQVMLEQFTSRVEEIVPRSEPEWTLRGDQRELHSLRATLRPRTAVATTGL